MFRVIFHRLLIAVPVLIGISLLVFFLIQLQPGDPLVGMISPETTPEQKQEMLRQAGYLDPIWLQYLRWASRAMVGDFGYSLQSGAPVLTLIGERVFNTLLLAGSSLLITLIVALPLGIYLGLRRGATADIAVSLLSFVILSIPVFFIAILLVKVFAMNLRWFPVSGVSTLGSHLTGFDHIVDVAKHLVLPAVTLALGNIAIFSRYLRSSISELINQNFIKALFARGMRRSGVIYPHLLKNAAKPLITVVGMEIPALLSATLLTEIIFNWPGIGRLSFDAIQSRDFPLLMGIVLFLAVITLAINILADILYALADPRVRLTR
ncbi:MULTISPECIES: ABC transporter permease [Erwinia]|uniref:Peptide ABC transporter permease n=1 Tax=Erwinia rhapontici TaxID=55212 RepID=A0ABN6DLN3_ERWRD|nr:MULTISPECIES: ABC transporter permease [Erwinia]MCS3607476.1 peptide/nickel transport system permease protein [Erwinia rhapontici]NKG29879.1 ABC transporter permease [Erwinia rhapontici]NNS07715.1 ABC transporter permease [Erwinia sp. JH02]TDT02067.1 peptide/nickel transport system permease protein [Erwinia rhapontici]BCQ35591.1 peptide ABC transporter permease [Erwinia rhapontici]